MTLSLLGDRKLFEQLPQAALLLDLQGGVLATNRQACHLLKTEEQALLGRHADDATGFFVLGESCSLEEIILRRSEFRVLAVERQDALHWSLS